MAVAAPGLILAATAVSTATAVASGVQGAMAARAQSQAAARNAEFARELGERNARAAIGDAQAEEARFRRDSARRIAAFQTRVSGGSGATLTGTPLAMLGDAVAEAEEQALLIRHGGALGAQQSRLSGGVNYSNLMGQSSVYNANVGQSLLSGFGQAAGSAMSGTATYMQMQT